MNNSGFANGITYYDSKNILTNNQRLPFSAHLGLAFGKFSLFGAVALQFRLATTYSMVLRGNTHRVATQSTAENRL